MNDREKWRERVKDIRASGTTWWWWWCHLVGVNLLYINQSIFEAHSINKRNLFPLIPDIGIMVTVFAKGPGDLSSIPGRVIPKAQKRVLYATLLNTQHYQVKWSNLRKAVAPPLYLGVVAIEKGAFGSPSTTLSLYLWSAIDVMGKMLNCDLTIIEFEH